MTNPKNDDINQLSKSNSSLTICPRSNGALSVGIIPLFEVLKTGVKPLIGSDNIMINRPNLFREMEFTLKIMKGFSKNYIAPVEVLKMATTNVCVDSSLSSKINKSYKILVEKRFFTVQSFQTQAAYSLLFLCLK